jgi:hypothetical protein
LTHDHDSDRLPSQEEVVVLTHMMEVALLESTVSRDRGLALLPATAYELFAGEDLSAHVVLERRSALRRRVTVTREAFLAVMVFGKDQPARLRVRSVDESALRLVDVAWLILFVVTAFLVFFVKAMLFVWNEVQRPHPIDHDVVLVVVSAFDLIVIALILIPFVARAPGDHGCVVFTSARPREMD